MEVKLPELLAPAGNMERLIAAFLYGADAAYIGASSMSLRNFADNFTFPEMAEAAEIAHSQGKRIYLACNSFARDTDIEKLPDFLENAAKSNVDALIVNDPGVIRVAKQVIPDMELHLSTQANTLNTQTALFWHELGIKRIVLARELTLSEITSINANTPESLEFEMFVHGAMCISYSGRCLLSTYLTGRDSNKGECAQPCRWSYEMRERDKNGEYFDIIQDGMGTHVMNSKDMNLIAHLPEVINTGVVSLKIEGRMKSVLYVSTVVNAYRMALDAYKNAIETGTEYTLPQEIEDELLMVSHRPYTTGFAFSDPKESGQETHTSKYVTDYKICGVVLSYDDETKTAYVRQRNRFFVGDEVYVLSPKKLGDRFTIESITNEEGEQVECAPHPNEHIYIPCEAKLKAGDILRRKVYDDET